MGSPQSPPQLRAPRHAPRVRTAGKGCELSLNTSGKRKWIVGRPRRQEEEGTDHKGREETAGRQEFLCLDRSSGFRLTHRVVRSKRIVYYR